jgi:hypothetical protein
MLYSTVLGQRVSDALSIWRRLLESNGTLVTKTITHPQGVSSYEVIEVRSHGFWVYLGDSNGRHFWCPYGLDPFDHDKPLNITLEINPIVTKRSQARGRVVIDADGNTYLAHRGGRGGGRGRQVTVAEFHEKISGVERIEVGSEAGVRDYFLLGGTSNLNTHTTVASYLRQAEALAEEAAERNR